MAMNRNPQFERMLGRMETLNRIEKWAEKHGMSKDPKMSGGYHFATLYPAHIEEFWKILRVEEDHET